MFEEINANILAQYDFESGIPVGALSCWGIDRTFNIQAKNLEMKADLNGMRAAAFFGALCSLSFNPSSNALFDSQWQWDGNRSAKCSDFKPVINELNTLMQTCTNPALLARISDVIWELNRDHSAAQIALRSYINCIFMDCTVLSKGLPDPITEKNIERAIQISNALDRKREKPEFQALNEIFNTIIEQTFVAEDKFAFMHYANIAEQYNVGDLTNIAKKCETHALNSQKDAHRSQQYWDLATALYRRLRKTDESNRCALNGAYCSISIADKFPEYGNSLAVSNHIEDAIMRLRRIPQTQVVRSKLKKRLLVVQEQIVDEMSVFKTEGINISDIFGEIQDAVAEMNFIESLREFALVSDGLSKKALETQVRDIAKSSIFLSMFSTSLTDRKGRTIAKYPYKDLSNYDEQSDYQLNRVAGFHWEMDYQARIEPIRLSTHAKFNPCKEDFYTILRFSPFVPNNRIDVVARGFEAYFKADFIAAINILVPQIEHCLREYLGLCGIQITKLLDDGTQEDIAISKLFQNSLPEIEKFLGENLAFEFNMLFLKRGAGKIRHSIAHGEYGDGEFWDPKIGYACWMIFKMIFITSHMNWARIKDIYNNKNN